LIAAPHRPSCNEPPGVHEYKRAIPRRFSEFDPMKPGGLDRKLGLATLFSAIDSTLTSLQALGAAAGAWLDLAIRFWLAKAFLTETVVSMAMHTPVTMSFATGIAPTINALVASPFGAVVAALCPMLLIIGLCSRIAALPLLFEACALHGLDGLSPLHLYWALLLGWIIVRGPGAISVDALLSRGLVSTAIPGTAALGRATGAATRVLEPWYRLALRLWIATAPLAVGATVLGSGGGMLDRLGVWLASYLRTMGAAPLLSLIVAGLLISGFGTRIVAVALALAVPLSGATMQLDERLYWALALGILILRGPGPFSLDRLVEEAFRRAARREAPKDESLPHVVVVGGGFGGIAAARGLAGAACRVTLVDRRNYHLFQPLLYQVATAGLSPADIATPIRSLFRLQPNVRVLLGEVVGVRPATREVMIGRSSMSYDYLVVATGAQHSYFGKDDWAAYAPGLKTLEDATEIRRRLLTAFERAEGADDPAERAAWMTFVIVGGGPTGVELAGAIAELARHGLDKEFRAIDPAAATVVLVQSAARLLPTFPAALSIDAAATLERLGVTVRLGAKVSKVDENGVLLAGEALAARTVLWAAGVQASPAAAWLGAQPDKAGRASVGPDLSVDGTGMVFAIGDVAASLAWNGQLVPGLAPAAKQGGAYVARVIRERIEGRPAPKPFRYRHAGSLATIGRQAAVADFHGLKVRGAVAWWLWGAAHILFLVGARNRSAVLLEWVWAYLTYRRGSRLITNRPAG
jgi:NADH dehydrogenase/putative oxidoreductase